MNCTLGVFCTMLAALARVQADELSMPHRWPGDLCPTLDSKAVVAVGGSAKQGNGMLDLVDADTFTVLKSVPLPEHQAASSVVIVPRSGSGRGAAVIAMKTQMIGVPDSVYMVSLEDSSFGNVMWKWTPVREHGDLFTSHNAALARDASGTHIYVGTGSFKARHGYPTMYDNRWWLHILDVTGPEAAVAGLVELPAYTAKSWYEGFGIFSSAHHGHVIAMSNMAGLDVGNAVVVVEDAVSDSRQVHLHNLTRNGRNPAWYNVLSWDASGAGFYADVSFWNKDMTNFDDFHMHYDVQKRVAKYTALSNAARRVEAESYTKGVLSGSSLYYTKYDPSAIGTQGVAAAFDTESLEDKAADLHFGSDYWPKAVTVAGNKLWVSWQRIEDATLNRYSMSSAIMVV